MTKFRVMTAAAAAALAAAVLVASAFAAAPAPAAGKSCTKAGATAKAGKTNLTCTKQGKKLVWVASAAKPSAAGVAFSARFEGPAAVKQSGSAINILVSGVSGSGSPLGSAKLDGQGVGNSNAKPCPTFGGDGSMSAGGDKLTFHVNESSSGCPDQDNQNQVMLKGSANVTGGSGKYAKAKGTLGFNGTFDRDSGTVSVSFSGSITL